MWIQKYKEKVFRFVTDLILFKELRNKQILRLWGNCFQITAFYFILALLTKMLLLSFYPHENSSTKCFTDLFIVVHLHRTLN